MDTKTVELKGPDQLTENRSSPNDLLPGKIGVEPTQAVSGKQTSSRPRVVYTVKASRLSTSTAKSVLVSGGRYYDSPNEALYGTLKAAQRATLRAAREEADELEERVRILFVAGSINGANSVDVFEVEEIELEPDDDGDDDT
jgi:hypothetical protein